MSVSWKQCEGHVLNNTFPLRQYLGGSRDSAVFLTELLGGETSKAAVKVIPERHGSDLQLSLWRRAAQLSHPNLVRVFQSGRCRLADLDLLYVAMEFAEEDLSQILPERALTSAEVRDMLQPLLSALNYLHVHGLVHTHVKPSNVQASGNQLKLSIDTLFPVGEIRKVPTKSDIYTAPESRSLAITAAADAWSLGVTLVETLTQHVPEWMSSGQGEPRVPDSVPQPFLDIARNTLRSDPRLRWSLADVSACLNPVAAAAAAGHSASPLAIPLSSVPAIPAGKLQSSWEPSLPMQAQAPSPRAAEGPKPTIVLPSYVLPVAAGAVLLVGIFALPKILGRRAEAPSASKSVPASSATAEQVPAVADAKPVNAPPLKSSVPAKHSEEKPAQGASSLLETPRTDATSAAPASLRTETVPPSQTPPRTTGSPVRGEILDQVLPEVSEKAQATIQGTVRVTVLLHVDAAGNVSDAQLDSPGPSQYFANLALSAARRWEFSSPEVAGRSAPSEWRVRFEFKQSGVKAFPTQTTP